MKSLDFASMENIQGGSSGNFAINLPITALLGALGAIGVGIGLGFSYSIDILPSTLPSLPLGL